MRSIGISTNIHSSIFPNAPSPSIVHPHDTTQSHGPSNDLLDFIRSNTNDALHALRSSPIPHPNTNIRSMLRLLPSHIPRNRAPSPSLHPSPRPQHNRHPNLPPNQTQILDQRLSIHAPPNGRSQRPPTRSETYQSHHRPSECTSILC